MKNLVPFLLLSLLISCQQNNDLTYTEKRLVGSWFYNDVDYTPRWSFKNDITSDYFGDILTFNDDFSFMYENNVTGELYQGVWQVNLTSTANSGSNSGQNSDQVIASYENTGTGEIIQLVWDNFCVTKNRITAQNSVQDGYFNFELKKF